MRFMSDLTALVLAAGQGTRMKSVVSKVLHPIAGRPLIHYPVRAALDAGATRVLIVASATAQEPLENYLAQAFGKSAVRCTLQDPPRGTGDAVRVGLEAADAEHVLIV